MQVSFKFWSSAGPTGHIIAAPNGKFLYWCIMLKPYLLQQCLWLVHRSARKWYIWCTCGNHNIHVLLKTAIYLVYHIYLNASYSKTAPQIKHICEGKMYLSKTKMTAHKIKCLLRKYILLLISFT